MTGPTVGSTCRPSSSWRFAPSSWSSASARVSRPTRSWSAVKLGVVLFVIGVGSGTSTPPTGRAFRPKSEKSPTRRSCCAQRPQIAALVPDSERQSRARRRNAPQGAPGNRATSSPRRKLTEIKGMKGEASKWGLISLLGLNRWLEPLDDRARSPFMPYGLSGIMVGAALVFFAYIGFDAISTHSEEAKTTPARRALRHHRLAGRSAPCFTWRCPPC